MLPLALLLFALLHGAALTLVLRIRPMALSGAMPLACCLVVTGESLLLNLLSLFRAVTFTGMLLAHGAVLILWLVWLRTSRPPVHRWLCRLRSSLRSLAGKPALAALAPVLLLLLFMLLHYPPTNWDSMTYHMARVAHWVQNQSIGYYPTAIPRQNQMGPGAEYLILFFQILTGSDRLANSVQFLAFLLLPGACFYLARVLGIPRGYRSPVVLLTVTAPMLLFQATSTQNDVVASLVAVAVIISAIRIFRGSVAKGAAAEYALFGACLAAGFLVKPTALLAALPIAGTVCLLRSAEVSRHKRAVLQGALIAIGVLVLLTAPDFSRKLTQPAAQRAVYRIDAGWTTGRLLNPVKMTFQHVPWPDKAEGAYRAIGIQRVLYSNVFRPHNDYIGNPVQALCLFAVTAITLLCLPAARGSGAGPLFRACVSLAPIAAWLTFGLLVKDNPWISRVQLPLFALLPVSCLFITRYAGERLIPGMCVKGLFWLAAVFSLMLSFFQLSHAEHRPLTAGDFFSPHSSRTRERLYYMERPKLEMEHRQVRMAVAQARCTRLGLLIGEDDWEYPLTWLLMQQGVEVRHIADSRSDQWSCMVYVTDREKIPLLAADGRWRAASARHLWQRIPGDGSGR